MYIEQIRLYLKIPEILPKILELVGEKKLEELTTVNPENVLKNENIEIDEPSHIKLSLKEKLNLY